jgi:hypothetical protein
MPQQSEREKFFAEEEIPLPMHILMLEEMKYPRFSHRFYESELARSEYDCSGFYKHISRPLLLGKEKGNS